MGKSILSLADLEKLSLSSSNFTALRTSKQIYIDKSGFIADLALQRGRFFLSRPRRFGKSLLLSTFAALFSRGITDFTGLDIEKKWYDDTKYPVIHLNFASYRRENPDDFIKGFNSALEESFKESFPNLRDMRIPENATPDIILSKFIKKTDIYQNVILIDEYDAPIVHNLNNENTANSIIDIIGSFFNTLKEFSYKCRFIFITGITRIAHVSLFSDVNFLEDISFSKNYNQLLGITANELHFYYHNYIMNAASILDMSIEDVYKTLRSRYDGYQFSPEVSETVYNPWSVLNFLKRPHNAFANYWYDSGGTPSLVMNYFKGSKSNVSKFIENDALIEKDFLISKKYISTLSINKLRLKSNSNSIPYNLLLLQTGYFTLRYKNSSQVNLCLPNEEVSDSLILLYLQCQNQELSSNTLDLLDTLPDLIDTSSFESIIKIFNTILTECISPKSNAFFNEYALRDIIYTMIPDKHLYKSRETPNSLGYVDLDLKTKKKRLCLEFKRSYSGKTDERALREGIDQMKTRKYGIGTMQVERLVLVLSTEKKAITAWAQVSDVL